MADIRINQLPPEDNPVASENVAIDAASTRRTTIQKLVYAGRPSASQAEAEAGTDPDKAMTPLTTAQAIAAQALTPGSSGATGLAILNDASVDDVYNTLTTAVWDSGTTRTMKQRATDTYCILDAPGNPDPTGNNESTSGLVAMAASGVNMEITRGDFVTSEALLIKTPGVVLFGHGGGYGYGNVQTALPDYVGHSRIIATGNAAKRRVMTRRRMRAAPGDPNDPAMCAVIDIEADGCQLNDLTIWLDCDYTNLDPSNLGADWDIGVFVGTRPGFQARNLQVLGYFRRAGIYLDVSNANGYPALLDYDGNPLASSNPSEFNGGDGTHLWNPYVRGGRVGLAVLGGINDTDANYYAFGEATSSGDFRGGSGFSDFNVFGGRLYGPDHHSGQRLRDPVAVPMTQAGLIAENDDTIAGAVFIDGRCSNASSTTNGIGALRGMNFFNTRVSTFEKFRAYLRRCDEVSFIGRAWSDTPLVSCKNTSGVTISSQDYVNSTYGHHTLHPNLTGMIHFDRRNGGDTPSYSTWMAPGKWSGSSPQGQVMPTSLRVSGDSSKLSGADEALSVIVDNNPSPSDKGGQVVQSYRPFWLLNDLSGGSVSFEGRVDANAYSLLYGAYTPGSPLPSNAYTVNVSIGRFEMNMPLRLPRYAVVDLPNAGTMQQGTVVFCTNGNSGQPCLAVAQAGSWFRIPLGTAVSA